MSNSTGQPLEIVAPEQVYPLRQKVLRPGRAISTCYFEGDHDTDTTHFAIRHDDEIVSVASLYAQSKPELASGRGWQLRGMATDDGVRGRGYGATLLQGVERYIIDHGADYLWANARTGALRFYQRAGYEVVGDEFIIPDVGPHRWVLKTLVISHA